LPLNLQLSTWKMNTLTISNKYDILNSVVRKADFLCQNDPLGCVEKHTVFLTTHRQGGFLLEGNMPTKLVKHECRNCGTIFLNYLSNHRKYCSQKCRNQDWSKILKDNHPRYWLGKHRSKETKEKIRKNGNFSKRGSLHPSWKGDNIKSYSALHVRVRKQRGEPRFCEICNTTNTRKKYEWANLTGDFINVMDYKRMCILCHRAYDKKRRQK